MRLIGKLAATVSACAGIAALVASPASADTGRLADGVLYGFASESAVSTQQATTYYGDIITWDLPSMVGDRISGNQDRVAVDNGFNDRISAIDNRYTGYVMCFYENTGFTGAAISLPVGFRGALASNWLDNKISSFRAATPGHPCW